MKGLTYHVDFLVTIFGCFVFSLPLQEHLRMYHQQINFCKLIIGEIFLFVPYFGFITIEYSFLVKQLIPIALVTSLAHIHICNLFVPFLFLITELEILG